MWGGAAIVAVPVGPLRGNAVRVADVGSPVQGGAAGVVTVAVTTACGACREQLRDPADG